MLHYIYSRPLSLIIIFMITGTAVWSYLCQKIPSRCWGILCSILSLASFAAILYTTVFIRPPGRTELLLCPFTALLAARRQPELYREMLMNVFLFFPLGLALPYVFPRQIRCRTRILLTALTACIFSITIECIQYCYALGIAETDDVICNTLGAFIGATSLLLAYAIEKYKEKPTSMTLAATETQFLHIAKAAVSGGELPTEAVDWSAIFTLAAQQKLLPILFETVRKTPDAEKNAALFAAIKQQVIGQVLNQTVRSAEFTDLYRKLRTAGLHPVVVKGQLCSRLYPLCDHRISADDDLFIPETEFSACHEALLVNGLTTDTPVDELPIADEVSYSKKGSPLYIELHRHLFDSTKNAHDVLNPFFDCIHSRAIEIDGMLSMPPHDHLLYLILHAYKHFVSRGVGLRQFCDIGLWARKYEMQIDWALLHSQCAKVHAATFAAAVFEIARTHLGIEWVLPPFWNVAVPVEPLLHDALCGGIYGSNSTVRLHASTATLNAVHANRTGRSANLLRSVFPNRVYLQQQYTYLKRFPILLPAAWAQRLFRYVCKRENRRNPAAPVNLARERIQLMELYKII